MVQDWYWWSCLFFYRHFTEREKFGQRFCVSKILTVTAGAMVRSWEILTASGNQGVVPPGWPELLIQVPAVFSLVSLPCTSSHNASLFDSMAGNILGVCEPIDSPQCQGQFLTCEKKEWSCPAINSSDVKSIKLQLPANTTVPDRKTTYMCVSLRVSSNSNSLISEQLNSNTNNPTCGDSDTCWWSIWHYSEPTIDRQQECHAPHGGHGMSGRAQWWGGRKVSLWWLT